ncbi:MAG TPA: thioredoxin family protein [Myxococcota bacterium]|nr:thioredoxin family protein [Myxococcota bacterium]
MDDHKVVSRSEWIEARKRLLAEEKSFTQARDRLSQQRRDLPWERVEKQYSFEGPKGKESLPQLFDGRSQLIVYHLMFDPSWKEACKSCSFWADNFNGIVAHLRQRDVTLLAISRAPFQLLEGFKKRMGWSFKWVSSFDTDFNHDYQVSFTPEELAKGQIYYNYEKGQRPFSGEAPGISVFYQDPHGDVFHTYSCYARGLDMMNGAYHYLDLVPKGRDEKGLPHPMAWVRHHDRYEV